MKKKPKGQKILMIEIEISFEKEFALSCEHLQIKMMETRIYIVSLIITHYNIYIFNYNLYLQLEHNHNYYNCKILL